MKEMRDVETRGQQTETRLRLSHFADEKTMLKQTTFPPKSGKRAK
jgi:hypothetical protein